MGDTDAVSEYLSMRSEERYEDPILNEVERQATSMIGLGRFDEIFQVIVGRIYILVLQKVAYRITIGEGLSTFGDIGSTFRYFVESDSSPDSLWRTLPEYRNALTFRSPAEALSDAGSSILQRVNGPQNERARAPQA